MLKKVFGDENDKRPLRELLKCILDINPKGITILNLEILSSSYYDKRTTVDLIVELDDGTKKGVEINTNVNRYLIDRNIFYMFKIMSKDMKKRSLYSKLNKHIEINIDCEGYHKMPIMKYKLIEDKGIAKSITKGEERMEKILEKVEDFSDDGAYDGELHRQEVAHIVMLDRIEKAEEQGVKQGSQKEKNKIVKNMLKENINKELISKVTGLNIEPINKLESE